MVHNNQTWDQFCHWGYLLHKQTKIKIKLCAIEPHSVYSIPRIESMIQEYKPNLIGIQLGPKQAILPTNPSDIKYSNTNTLDSNQHNVPRDFEIEATLRFAKEQNIMIKYLDVPLRELVYPTSRTLHDMVESIKSKYRITEQHYHPSFIGNFLYQQSLKWIFKKDIASCIQKDQATVDELELYLKISQAFQPQLYFHRLNLTNAIMTETLRILTKYLSIQSHSEPPMILAVIGKANLYGTIHLWKRFVENEVFDQHSLTSQSALANSKFILRDSVKMEKENLTADHWDEQYDRIQLLQMTSPQLSYSAPVKTLDVHYDRPIEQFTSPEITPEILEKKRKAMESGRFGFQYIE